MILFGRKCDLWDFLGFFRFTALTTMFLVFLWLWKTDGMFKYVDSDDSCIYNKYARAQNKGSHVEKKRSRLIHTLTWLNSDYHWLCVWFGSCENRRFIQIGLLAFFTAGQAWRTPPQPLQIKSVWTELGQTPNQRTPRQGKGPGNEVDAELHMSLIGWIGFGSCEVRHLTRASVKMV